MKKLLLVGAVALFGAMNAQNTQEKFRPTAKGNWVIEANTGSHATGNTAIGITAVDGYTQYSFGAEAGYFVMDNLAVKAGLGYQGAEGEDGAFAYKVGAQYYIIDKIPVGLDFTGTSIDGYNANWVGAEAGYALFLAPNVAITPKVRYNITLDDQKADSAFQGLVGFSFFF